MDKPVVAEFARRLRAEGFEAWVNDWEMGSGDVLGARSRPALGALPERLLRELLVRVETGVEGAVDVEVWLGGCSVAAARTPDAGTVRRCARTLVERSLVAPVGESRYEVQRWTAEGLKRCEAPERWRERCARAADSASRPPATSSTAASTSRRRCSRRRLHVDADSRPLRSRSRQSRARSSRACRCSRRPRAGSPSWRRMPTQRSG